MKKIDFKLLTDSRLKKYLKAEKARFFKFEYNFYCDICQEYHFENMTETELKLYASWNKYILDIKSELNKRNLFYAG